MRSYIYYFDYFTKKYISEEILYQTWINDDTELDYPYWLDYQSLEYVGNYKDVLYHRYIEE